ncbi:uncharacterized protein LOC110720546 [Chenopodium quinoa]|uniref:uncharacterized protein LOC110720546 n=1 Tax=Chenopodium quinoa TaxID=63459 RepID=UPI000B78A78F|nr:uncharacterized protein LOC110720546 [Chenopodium quinoa]
MEDCNMVISDCIIISCCCQCLLLQLLIFVFIQLPRRVARKTKEYAERKLRKRRKKKQGDHQEIMVDDHKQKAVYGDEFVGLDDDDKSGKSMSLRILELESMAMNELHNWGSCNEEVDKVLGELALKGEFGFGSFWGRNSEIQTRKSSNCYCKCNRRLTKEDELDFGSHVVKFHLIEVIESFD